MDRWVRCAKSFQTNLIWPSPVPYNGRYSVRPERKEEQEAADLHLFWVRPESEKVDQKLRGAAFRVLREEKTTEIRFNYSWLLGYTLSSFLSAESSVEALTSVSQISEYLNLSLRYSCKYSCTAVRPSIII